MLTPALTKHPAIMRLLWPIRVVVEVRTKGSTTETVCEVLEFEAVDDLSPIKIRTWAAWNGEQLCFVPV